MLKKKPLVSVVIPYYDMMEIAFRTIDSVLSQDFDKNLIEIIVSDENKKGINRKKFENKSPVVRYFTNQYKEGPGGNRQTGLSRARGEFIVFLDSDDVLFPDFLKTAIWELEKDKSAAGVICFSKILFDGEFTPVNKFKINIFAAIRNIGIYTAYLLNRGYCFSGCFYLCQFSHMLFRTNAVKKIRFNYAYRHGGEDWDFFAKVLTNGKIKIITRRILYFCFKPGRSSADPRNKRLKSNSYLLLRSRLDPKIKKSIFSYLLIWYILLLKLRYRMQRT